MNRPLYQHFASLLQAIENCKKTGNKEWLDKHRATLKQLIIIYLPSGAGFDRGTAFKLDLSNPEKLVFETDFHHMNDHGYYDGWTTHRVTVTGGLLGLNIKISGPNRNDIKDHIHEVFDYALTVEVDV